MNAPTHYSLLVVRNGYLVYERYFHGSYAAQENNIKSMSKSVLSVLTGIAIEEGRIEGIDDRVQRFFPEYFQPSFDPRKFEITVEDLLTMRGGLEWSENTAVSWRMWSSRDWIRHMIESPLVSNPGEVFNYNTGLTHVLSGVLTRATGQSTLDYARTRLFEPLGMHCTRWSRDPMGYYFGGSEVWLTSRDLARFGLLALRRGSWEDRQIVSERWMHESTRVRVRTWGNPEPGDGYGYLWWTGLVHGYPMFYASGYGGQHIFVVPELDLVMVMTANSDSPNAPGSVYERPFNVLWSWVVPAITGPAPAFESRGVVSAADYSPVLAPGSFASLFGSGLALVSTTWDSAMPLDGRLPESVGGVRVRIGDRFAPLSYAGPGQVNFLVPADLTPGRYSLDVLTARGNAHGEIDVAAASPAWFNTGVCRAKRGQVVELYASGLGPVNPAAPVSRGLTEPLPLITRPRVSDGTREYPVEWAGLVYAGVYQVNVRIPENADPGSAKLRLTAGDRTSAGVAEVEIRE